MEWDLGRRLVLEWGQRLFLCSHEAFSLIGHRAITLLLLLPCERHTCVGAYVGTMMTLPVQQSAGSEVHGNAIFH